MYLASSTAFARLKTKAHKAALLERMDAFGSKGSVTKKGKGTFAQCTSQRMLSSPNKWLYYRRTYDHIHSTTNMLPRMHNSQNVDPPCLNMSYNKILNEIVNIMQCQTDITTAKLSIFPASERYTHFRWWPSPVSFLQILQVIIVHISRTVQQRHLWKSCQYPLFNTLKVHFS